MLASQSEVLAHDFVPLLIRLDWEILPTLRPLTHAVAVLDSF